VDRHALGEQLGRLAGIGLAPLTATVSSLRGARMFHPRGVVLRAAVVPVARTARWEALAGRLEGHALVRLSAALFERAESIPDVLGCAIRFTEARPTDARALPADQDLLLATIRRPWTMALSPFTTDVRDYMNNHYFGVCPFRSAEGVIEWRLSPEQPCPAGLDRASRLAEAIARGRATFTLEARAWPGSHVIGDTPAWASIARVELLERIDVDEDALRFDPFRSGRGIAPTGFVHGLRAAAYAASQRARPGPRAP
jgi:hypothetical protein